MTTSQRKARQPELEPTLEAMLAAADAVPAALRAFVEANEAHHASYANLTEKRIALADALRAAGLAGVSMTF